LKNRDLNREVERGDNSNWSIWPSVTSSELTLVITGILESMSEESHTITSEILQEVDGDLKFG
jgi:hypothetical protein